MFKFIKTVIFKMFLIFLIAIIRYDNFYFLTFFCWNIIHRNSRIKILKNLLFTRNTKKPICIQRRIKKYLNIFCIIRINTNNQIC